MTDNCRCGQPLRDTLTVCDDCAQTLAIALGDIPWIVEQLDVTITGQRALPINGGGRTREKPLPWHEAASEVLGTLKHQLVAWARLCEQENIRHQSPRTEPLGEDDDTCEALSRWLMWRIDGLARHELGPDAVEEITDTLANAHRFIDRRPERWYAGPCIQDIDGNECGTDLYAKSRRGDVTCPKCKATYDVAARREWLLAEAEDRLANATSVARAVSWLGAQPLTPSLVRKWAERGRITAKAHDGRSPLYRIGDALDVLASEARRMSH